MFAVLDLPQLYQKPTVELLLQTLRSLGTSATSFDPESTVDKPINISPEDIPQYLTSIIASPLSWIGSDVDIEHIHELASERLSERAGRTAQGAMTRAFTVPLRTLSDPEKCLTLKLYEPALVGDNLGFKTWGSSHILARRLHLLFDSCSASSPRTLKSLKDAPSPKSPAVLELGSGTGLLGLAAAGVWHAHVTLTDLPAIAPNLHKNIEANCATLSDVAPNARVTCGVLDWNVPTSLTLYPDVAMDRSQEQRFDMILAADPIYGEDHPLMVTQAVLTWLLRTESARFFLTYPLRQSYKEDFAKLRCLLREGSLEVLQEGEELGKDDWADDVLHCWSVWGWNFSQRFKTA